jgi:copper chaperone CopZ
MSLGEPGACGPRAACGRLHPPSSYARVREGATTLTTETIQVSGVRCERCVNRLAATLSGHDGLESASANLMGEVTLSWDERRTTRESLLDAMARGGFNEVQARSEAE